jgi:two-component system cell cycle response regulator
MHRLILIDPEPTSRANLSKRLEGLGYAVTLAEDGISGAGLALADPPDAVIADLWTPGASGVQICRFLRSEPATAMVPVLLRGNESDRRNRFWARRAGAATLVSKGRIGELLRVLEHELEVAPKRDDFFMQLSGGMMDVRERIARHLDVTLFESVIAAEVRALSACDTPERLFDRLTQFVSQVHSYRWLAMYAPDLSFFAIHQHPESAEAAEDSARRILGVGAVQRSLRLEDEDTSDDLPKADPIVQAISLGQTPIGRIALSPSRKGEMESSTILAILARELGGPLRVTSLVEETRRLASTDPLTGLLNRRAFNQWMEHEGPRAHRYAHPLSLALLDIDHFKSVNDRHGHDAGDAVLVKVALVVRESLREADIVARWGGEEIVIALPDTDHDGALRACERVRAAIEAARITTPSGSTLAVTASIGVASLLKAEQMAALVARADAAMYRAKAGGRNRVVSGARQSSAPLSGTPSDAEAELPESERRHLEQEPAVSEPRDLGVAVDARAVANG